MAGPPTARGQRVCISGVSSQPPGSLWRHSGQGEEQVGPKAEVAHAVLGPRCREGLRGGKGFGAQRHLPGERNRQTIYRPLRGGFTEPPWPLGRGARSQQGGRRLDPGRRRGPGRRAHAPHRRGRGQRHNVSSWCVRKMTPEKVSRGRARDRESGAGPSSRERTRRPPWRRELGPDRSPAAWGPRFPPSPQLRRSLSVGPWPCRSQDERREAG